MSSQHEADSIPRDRLCDRILGALLGAAVGDAIGAPCECKHYREIRRIFGDFQGFADLEVAAAESGEEFWRPLGEVTDDTYLADLLLDCILANGGDIDAHVFASAWNENFEKKLANPDGADIVRLERVHWIERIPFYRNRLRDIPKRELGHGEANATNALMYILPVGLLCSGEPLQAALMAADVTAVNQHGRSRDVAAGYCAAVAVALLPGATVEQVVEAGVTYTRDEMSVGQMRPMLDLARRCRTGKEYIERYYQEIIGPVIPLRDWQHADLPDPVSNSWISGEVLGIALAALLLTTRDIDPREMILTCCKIGRDSDTIARVAGGLIGAMEGTSAIPADWGEYVLARNRWMHLEEKAGHLASIVRQSLDRRRAVAGRVLADADAHVVDE